MGRHTFRFSKSDKHARTQVGCYKLILGFGCMALIACKGGAKLNRSHYLWDKHKCDEYRRKIRFVTQFLESQQDQRFLNAVVAMVEAYADESENDWWNEIS